MGLSGVTPHKNPSAEYAQQSGTTRILAQVYGDDLESGKQSIIGYDENQVHEGNKYGITGVADLQAGIGHLFNMKCEKTAHFRMSVFGILQTSVVIYEASSFNVSSAGSVLAPINHNRESANTTVMSMFMDGVITNSGGEIYSQSRQNHPIEILPKDEFMVNSGVWYTARVISFADSNHISYGFGWIED